MSNMPWVYCSALSECAEIELPPEELRHLVGSHRRRTGDFVVLFDGLGEIAYGTLQELTKRPLKGRVKIVSNRSCPKPLRKTHLASALPKGERQGLMLELVTQLGVTDFTPLACARSIARPGRRSYERWQRILVDACKQCRRPWLPELHSESTLMELLNRNFSRENTVILADQEGRSSRSLNFDDLGPDYVLIVGPEGGFTVEERKDLISRCVLPVSLSEHNLRVETAATALVSLVIS